jgi:phospholipid/cholesterol/gamma-HCH transport system permease protein
VVAMSIDEAERDEAGRPEQKGLFGRPKGEDSDRDDSNKATDYGEGYSLITDIGEVGRFAVKIVRYLPGTSRCLSEVLRQVGILVLSSTAIIWFMEAILAAEISLEGHYLLRQLGAGGYTGVFTAVSDYTVAPEMWGWVLTAKVGCGLVAELGSMRISEEIDALEVMGMDSMSYLIGTRFLAMLIYTPFMFIAASEIMYQVNYILNVNIFQSVSAGQFLAVHYTFLTQQDVVFSFIAALIIGLGIVITGCYYGYNATGGPVGVGKATAKSAIINLIIVSAVGAIFQQLFFGGFLRAPIAK